MKRALISFASLVLLSTATAVGAGQSPMAFETRFVRFELQPSTGQYRIIDKRADVTWGSDPYAHRFGEVTVSVDGHKEHLPLTVCTARRTRGGIQATFHPVATQPAAWVRILIRPLRDGQTLEFRYSNSKTLNVERIRLLDNALWTSSATQGYIAVPVREGLLIPADSGKSFRHDFDTYAYEGCHMEMLGVVKHGAAALLTWDNPYVLAQVRSTAGAKSPVPHQQILSPSLVLRESARRVWMQFLGQGDYVTIAKAYRRIAKKRGLLVTWKKKLFGHPNRAKLFGAVDFKLWSCLDRRMNEASTKQESVRVNWTFAEAAQVAEHLKRDLHLAHVLFIIGGWNHRGYDNQFPDVLPAAPECGGNRGLAACSRKVRALGYLFGLHDNYQDIYRDSPSWNTNLIMKTRDGRLAVGGRWAGGRAYLICSEEALQLAKRPQNLPGVYRITHANAYFIDTTFAAGLQECFDPHHPLRRGDDMKWKEALADYARSIFGVFGSEDGREWAIPHSDFFEGMTGVSGHPFHNRKLLPEVGGAEIPLFELVYRNCIAMYGKYGYDPAKAAPYVLEHIVLGRTLNYHSIPPHLYWKRSGSQRTVKVRPLPPSLQMIGPRHAVLRIRWLVDKTPVRNWRVFVHFTDAQGKILFQADHDPRTPTSQWKPGAMESGLADLRLPPGRDGTFDIRVGLWNPATGARANLLGAGDGERRYLVGELHVHGQQVTLAPARLLTPVTPDLALFTRGDHGWTEGLIPLDRFIKNTYEILSPLNELTAQMPMTDHSFLTKNRQVQRSVFGSGKDAVRVVVNGGTSPFTERSRFGGLLVLPPEGFLIEAPTFVAFYADNWNGIRFPAAACFTLRSLDGKPLDRSRAIRVFHAFGEGILRTPIGDVKTTSEMVVRR